MEIIHGNEQNFDVLVQNDKVLVDFYANWCGPCKMLSPVLEDLASDRSDVKIVKIDVDSNPDLAKRFGVMSIPTLILFENGREVSKKQGFMPKQVLNEWVNDNN